MSLPLEADDLDRLRRVVHRMLSSPDGFYDDLPVLLQGWLSKSAVAVLVRAAEDGAYPAGLDARETILVGFLQPLLNVHIARQAIRVQLDHLRIAFGLTLRQAEAATLLARRASNLEIAEALRISPHTARRHTEEVLAKLGIADRRRIADVLKDMDANG